MSRPASSPCLVWSAVLVLGLASAASGAADEPFDYFRNSWNVIGLKDYTSGTRVTPDNRLLLADGRQVSLCFGPNLAALSRKQTKTLMDGWLPVIVITARDGPVRYDFTLWATPLPTVKDWAKAFDWPTEGENFLNWIAVRAVNTGAATAEAKVAIAPASPGPAPDAKTWSLEPGRSAEAVWRIPFAPVDDASAFAREDARTWLERTVGYWRGVMAGAARIEVPCEKTSQALLAAHVCQLIANDRGEVHGGEGFYDEFYIRDGAYQVMELEEAGLAEAARKAADLYLLRQRPDGRFESQAGQFDANGQAVWVLWQYYQVTGDRAWLEKVYPPMRRAADWTAKARREAPADSPFAGLLPNAVADGEFLWDGKYHIVGYDLWNLRGVLCVADAARALGKTDDEKALRDEAEAYRAAIDAAWKRTGLPHFPPSWEKVGTHWGDTETLWPTALFAADDGRVVALIDEVRHRFGGGFVEGTIRWMGQPDVIHPYMSAYTTMASLVRGEHEQVVEDFYWYLLHSTAAHAFPEGIYYKRRYAWGETIPHVTGACNYAILLRHMLVHEQGDDLHLLTAVPDGWLAEGKEIRVERAPTHFGVVSMTARGTAAGVEIKLDRPTRRPPARIVLHLPKSRPLVGRLDGVEVRLRDNQRTRWDWPTVVGLYEKDHAPLLKAIPGLVPLPPAEAVPAEQCLTLDLAAAANTDPLTAPFGVPNPGKFLFTGMPVGVQTVGGVPFRIIDPSGNDGRGFIVLHSPRAPTDRQWPREVRIPVGRKGKRLFFLGNVHGWEAGDPGAGEWGAVAEYVIRYADGQEQVVPLITGRTADDWAMPPEADEAFVGLRGDPWHLNVLGVRLRDAAVEAIIFRDLDTPAAPLLAAITLQP